MKRPLECYTAGIVVPLPSVMKDQVEGYRKKGLRVFSISAGDEQAYLMSAL